jgi:hypothetical protein
VKDKPREPAPALLLGFLVLACLLRLVRLGYEGLWLDEGYTFLLVRRPLGELLGQLRTDDAPPLFYLLEKAAAGIAAALGLHPGPEAAIRWLPALSAALAPLVLALSGGRRHLPGALVLAFASYGIFYARQGRSYGWLLLLVTTLLVALEKVGRGRRRWAWVVFGALAALLWSHHLGWFVWAAGLLWSVGLWRRRASRPAAGRLLLAHVGAALAALPWSFYAGGQLGYHALANQWMARYWEGVPLAAAPILSLVAFCPGSPVLPPSPANLPRFPSSEANLLALAAAVALVAAGVAGLWRRWREAPERPSILLGLHLLLVPLLGLALVSWLWAPTYVLGRSDVVAFPAFAWLLGLGFRGLGPLWGRRALGLLAVVGLASSLPLFGIGSSPWVKGTDRRVARLLAAELGPRDLLVHTMLTAPSLEAYLQAWGRRHAAVYFPEALGENPAATIPTPPESLRVYEAQARSLRAALEAGTWERLLLVGRLDPGADLTDGLQARDLAWPESVLAYLLRGEEAIGVLGPASPMIYQQDWVSGVRVLAGFRRAELVEASALGPIRVETR